MTVFNLAIFPYFVVEVLEKVNIEQSKSNKRDEEKLVSHSSGSGNCSFFFAIIKTIHNTPLIYHL